jgi:hypothetical protein
MRPSPLSLALLASVACADRAPTDASRAPTERVAASLQPRPMSGSCETTFPALQGPPPPVLQQIDVGTCQLSHLGRTALYSDKTINFAAGTQVTHLFRLTAANGDQLLGRGTGTSAPGGPGLVAFHAVVTLAGGTGRFADARGELRIEGVATLATSSSVLRVVDGWISY